MTDVNERIEIETAPMKMALLGFGALGFVATGVWIVRTTPSGAFIHLIGWASIVFFGLCAALVVQQVLTLRGPVVVIDRRGILDRRVSDEMIPWDKVQAISTWSHQNNKTMILKLDADFDAAFPTKRITRMTRGINAKLGADGIAINPSGLMLSYDKLLAAAIRFREGRAA
jgi:hypothetical protein